MAPSPAPVVPVVLVVVVAEVVWVVPVRGMETLVAIHNKLRKNFLAQTSAAVVEEAAARGLLVQPRPVAARLPDTPLVEVPPASVQRLRLPGLPSTTRAAVVEAATARATLVEQVAVVMRRTTPLVVMVIPTAVVAVLAATTGLEVSVGPVLSLLGISRLQCQQPVVP
jgi:hypothetical protein